MELKAQKQERKAVINIRRGQNLNHDASATQTEMLEKDMSPTLKGLSTLGSIAAYPDTA